MAISTPCRIAAIMLAVVGGLISSNLIAPPYDVAAASSVSTGLNLSPLKTEFSITPGTSHTVTLTITNGTQAAMKVDFSAESFSVINQQYDYAFDTASALSKWVTFDKQSVTLEKNQRQTVNYTVGAPLSAEPGGRYISLFASTDSAETSGISTRQRVGSLLYINVAGDVSRIGSLSSLTSPLVITDHTQWAMTLQNSGTTHFRSRYTVSVKNWITGATVAGMSGESLILPNTIRTVLSTLPTPKLPGIYTVEYNIGLGDTPSVQETHLLIYAPLPSLLLLASIIAILALFLTRRRKHKKA